MYIPGKGVLKLVKCRKYSLPKFANFVYFCIAIFACNTKVYNICKLCKAIFSVFYNISQQNVAIIYFSMLFLAVVIYLIYLFASRPDFEGRCGEVRTSPEIVLHHHKISNIPKFRCEML